MNKKIPRARLLACACCMAISVSALPAYADWKPELVVPSKGAFGASETIRISLPKLPTGTLPRLMLELDDFDVTGMVSREGNHALFTPPQAMSYGQHQLRLVEHAADGSIIERGVWTLDVRKNSAFREADLNANVTLNFVRRVSDDNLVDAPKRNQANGAAQLQGAVADGNWRLGGNADILANSQETQLPRSKHKVDVGNFLLTGTAGDFSVNAGHHAIAPESLVMQGFNRRGVSAGYASPETGAAVSGFGLRTQDIYGAQEGFGIGDSENRIDGITASLRPLASDRDALLIAATYLSGEGPDQIGTSIGGDTTVSGGRSSSFIADGNLLDRRLRLRGEVARTHFDSDGKGRDTDLDGVIDSNLSAEKSRAHTALVMFSPWQQKIVMDQPMAASIGIEKRRIGTFFRSPANPSGVADRQAIRSFVNFDWFGLNAQASLGHETDNVDDLILLPRTETTQGVVSLTYTPLQTPTADGQLPPPAWYGQPTYNVTHVDVDQGVEKATAGLASGALHATRNTTLSAMFNYSTWSWSAVHTFGKDIDYINAGPDTENKTTQLAANLRIGEKLSLNPNLQFNEVINNDSRTLDSETVSAGLSLGYAFSQRVNANLGYSANRQQVQDGSVNIRTHDITGSLGWMVQPAQGLKPGVALSLEGQYHDAEDRVTTSNDVENYQVFLKASVSWQPGY
ncbi:MAG: hypothetical protein NUV55_12830 [Sulfuricaulis sp.]|uniref:hypothetical protein n=1 Tax=Sulfuricaulis sp. TaxID=2003553 RepID=UPI0025EA1C66|nr:hypothetical protein [Sulfuricaulis sp.]MCR4348067.1 hypothetical protein [Sulfuricaulis sp.]